jgi:hypothetical protein
MHRFVLSLFVLSSLGLSSTALAQDDGDTATTADTDAGKEEAPEKKGFRRKSNEEKWCKDSFNGPEAWGCTRSISPSAGFSAIGNIASQEASVVLHGGISASIFNWQREGLLSTKIAFHGVYFSQAGSGAGYDVGLAGFVGVRKTHWAAAIGAELFRNYYLTDKIYLPVTNGLSIPIFFELGPEIIHLIGGIAPGFVSNPARRVDWALDYGTPGLGHEMSWYIGTEVTFRLFSIALALERERLANGVASWGATLGVGF